MTGLRYLNFDVSIQRHADGYQATVLDAPAGEASARFAVPFSDLEVENFLLRMGRPQSGMRRIDSPEVQATKEFGGKLFRALFDDAMYVALNKSLEEAGRQGAGLRIRLRLAAAPELAVLPWEYLYNPDANRFLALSNETPVVRRLPAVEELPALAIQLPLRILVVIASPDGYPPIDVENEWAKLTQSLADLQQQGRVVLDRLPQPGAAGERATLTALQRAMRRVEYHVFHFIGHGGFDAANQDGFLLLADDQGRGRPVNGEYLGTLLHDERTLRLAVLNACEGARASRDDPFSGVAQSLIQQGIPAVIAMQFAISNEAAVACAHEFYLALADGYPADAALAEARKAIYGEGLGAEWGTPVLYMRAQDGRIFDVAASGPGPTTAPLLVNIPAGPPVSIPAAGIPLIAIPKDETVKPQARAAGKSSGSAPPSTPAPPDIGGAAAGNRRRPLGLLAAGAVGVLAVILLLTRLLSGGDRPAGSTPFVAPSLTPSATLAPTDTPTAEPTATHTPKATATATRSVAPTATRTKVTVPTRARPTTVLPPVLRATSTPASKPTSKPTSAPTPCKIAAYTQFANAQRAGRLGCATEAVRDVMTSWQPFERGTMIWRSDTLKIYVLNEDDSWQAYADKWSEGLPTSACAEAAQLSPALIHGFSATWCTEPGVREALGNPLAIEKSWVGKVQPFSAAWILGADPALFNRDLLLVFFNTGAWKRYEPSK